MRERFYFLDNLRAFVIFLVIVLHGSMTYMAYAPEWWYVVDPAANSMFFLAVVLLTDVPIMLIMFFVAGYFAYPSLVKRGAGQFVKDKFVRIGLPWIFGVLVLAPPTAYMMFFSRNVPLSYSDFYLGLYWGEAYQQSVYWFLGVLFLFFALLGVVYASGGWLRNLELQPAQPSWRLFAGFGLLMTAGFLLMNQLYPISTWTHVWVFMFQPLRAPLYVGYFVLGMIAYQQRWFTSDGYRPGLWRWLPLWLGSGLLYLAGRLLLAEALVAVLWAQALNALLFNAFCLTSLMFGAAFFQRYINSSGAFWSSLAGNSYGIYYLHPLFLYPLAYLLLGVPLSSFIEAPAIILLTLLLSWAGSAFVLQKIPGVRLAFGGPSVKPPSKPLAPPSTGSPRPAR